VGADLHRFGFSTAEFHSANQERLRSWSHTMLATSTHDSKRSEDVRARINVLSEISALWRLRLRDWKRFNRRHKRVVNDQPAPSPNDEYLLYQTLVGAWPPESDLRNDNDNDWKTFRDRIEAYMLKAIREAKRNTSWINRNTEYEEAVSSFVKALLTPGAKNRFLSDFVPFQRRVARIGLWNSLSQTLLKLTCPGVPDIYQGNELLDFSLVDPDNRRQVDYLGRQQLFESVRAESNTPDASPVSRLLATCENGQIKLYLIWKTLELRQQQPNLFQRGEYVPLSVAGAKADHVIAFAREFENSRVLVIVPRLLAGLLNPNDSDTPPVGPQVWGDTHVLLPCGCPEKYRNVLTGQVRDLEAQISVSNALSDFPVGLWVRV
jgi:(1->4)-alpha-D-glucan 1-alpha-D-glucosylmutase